MDLTAAISNMQTAKLDSAVQISVAKKILDSQKQAGGAALQLLDATANGVAKAGDALTAQAIGLGGLVDTYG